MPASSFAAAGGDLAACPRYSADNSVSRMPDDEGART